MNGVPGLRSLELRVLSFKRDKLQLKQELQAELENATLFAAVSSPCLFAFSVSIRKFIRRASSHVVSKLSAEFSCTWAYPEPQAH